jgi:CheY-like chemotaxis protein
MLEGDGDDRYITQQTLSKFQIDIPIKFLSNSIEFFNFLSQSNEPVSILVDYNSVPESGLGVLKKLKSNSVRSDVPVVILSDSDYPRYKNERYKHAQVHSLKSQIVR